MTAIALTSLTLGLIFGAGLWLGRCMRVGDAAHEPERAENVVELRYYRRLDIRA